MKSITRLLNSLIMATFIVAIAIFSIQNIQDVSVEFLIWKSITVPVGVLLAFCSGIGMILGWFISLLFSRRKTRRTYWTIDNEQRTITPPQKEVRKDTLKGLATYDRLTDWPTAILRWWINWQTISTKIF